MHLSLNTKTKTNLSVITLTATIMAIPSISVIGLVVTKRSNSYLVSERKKEQNKVLPILAKIDPEKYYSQI